MTPENQKLKSLAMKQQRTIRRLQAMLLEIRYPSERSLAPCSSSAIPVPRGSIGGALFSSHVSERKWLFGSVISNK